jgi:hypothetical protein
MTMLNMSKYHQAIVCCSAIATATLVGFGQSASAQVQVNNSNAGGTGVTNNPSPIVATPSTPGTSFVGPASTFSSNVAQAQNTFIQASATRASLESAPAPVAANADPVRYAREVADAASCGCPNADTVSTKPTGDRPELVAARAAEAQAAAELAAAKAEARKFIESVKSSNATVDRTIW